MEAASATPEASEGVGGQNECPNQLSGDSDGASEAATRQASPAAAPGAEPAERAQGEEHAAAPGGQAPAERACPSDVWQACIEMYDCLGTARQRKLAGEDPLFIEATSSIIDAVLRAVLPLLHFQVERACEPVAALHFVSLRWFSL